VSGPRLVVSDTGPLITLEKLEDGFGFIRQLFDRIIVPPAVLEELYQGQFVSPEAYLTHYGIVDLVEVRYAPLLGDLPEIDTLDRGELEAISLALAQGFPLLIEETAGRRVARAMGVEISGIAGQVLEAYRQGILAGPAASGLLRDLLDTGRISTRIFEGLRAITSG
jgi:predicted nucleic acid-binding protein